MVKNKELNKTIMCSDLNEIEAFIEELDERKEFACTGNTCSLHACKIVGIEEPCPIIL